MKTILIPIFQGVEARNILRTGIFRTLHQKQDLKIVLLVSSVFKVDYYKKEFPESDRLKYEIVEEQPVGLFERFFRKIKVHLLKTETMDIKRRLSLLEKGDKINYFFSLVLNRLIAQRVFIKFFRFFDFYLIRDKGLWPLFEKYNPDAVFLAHLFGDLEVSILREAKKRKVKSIGFINSWDKLTSRCILRILPDWLVVPNEITKKEAERYHAVPEKRIFLGGATQFDIYKELVPVDREKFYTRLGIKLNKEIILFAPIGRAFSDFDSEVLETLSEIVKSHKLGKECHIIVRLPPNDIVNFGELNKENISIQKPGTRFSSERGVDWDMSTEDLQELVDTISNSSIVICMPSTLSIDACVADKPIINIKFNYQNKKREGFYKDPSVFYEMNHYKNLLEDGSVEMAKDRDELLFLINKYLKDRNIRKKERMISVKRQAGDNIGNSGKIIADFIIKNVDKV